jgi:hypothetical protein
MQKFSEPIARSNESLKLFQSPKTLLWLILSALVPIYFGSIALHHSLNHPYIFQDDAREYIIGLQRFVDPQLFPNDPIADYFQKIPPIGYKFVYWFFAKIGIEPTLLMKLIPTFLALIATIYFFLLSLEIVPIPATAFLCCLILNQNIWLKDDLISATPRAFVYPLFAAFFYYLVKESLFPCLITIGLQGLFYPQILLLECAILTARLFRWQKQRLQFSSNKKDYFFWIFGLIVATIVLIIFKLNLSDLGDSITASQMKQIPEFGARGRIKFFDLHPLQFMFRGETSFRFPAYPPTIWLSLGLPILLKSRSSFAKYVSGKVKILLQTIVASSVMYLLAHLFLFKLYLPSRYTSYSFRFVMAIGAGIVLSQLLSSGWNWLEQKRQADISINRQERFLTTFIGVVLAIALIVPIIPSISLNNQNWKIGKSHKIYEFIAAQPKDTLVASFVDDMDSFPTFTQRSILVAREYALPFHPKYYQIIQQRAIDLIRAQYSPNLSDLKQVIQKYGIDFFVLEKTSFNPDYLLTKNWLVNSSFQEVAIATVNRLKAGEIPALSKLAESCSVISSDRFTLVEDDCILKSYISRSAHLNPR